MKEHKDQEQAMYDVNVHHKTIMEYARFVNKNNIIDNCCKNNAMDEHQYDEFIKKELPNLHNAQNTISRMALIKDIHEKATQILL